MKTRNRKVEREKMGLSLLVIAGIILFSISLVSSAGFGSTYLPKVDGDNLLIVPIGSNVSYFIYPQNFENKTLLVKVNVTDLNGTMINTLKDYYEIPPNTSSDEYKIELVFALANNTELIGKKFYVTYDLLSTYKNSLNISTISFNPIGYTKDFYVVGNNSIPVIPPVVTPTPTQSSGGNNNPVPYVPYVPTQPKNTTKAQNLTKITTSIPVQEPLVTADTLSKINYVLWIAIGLGILGFIAVGIIIFRKVRNGNHNNHNKGYADYNNKAITGFFLLILIALH